MKFTTIDQLSFKNIHPDWLAVLADEKKEGYFIKLQEFLINEESNNKIIYPPKNLRYASLCLAPSDIKVVILGQDPYHNPDQAHGLSFSVPPSVAPPPSLVNIYKEINKEYNKNHSFANGCLLPWFNQGVFLLNTFLTVEKNKPASHRSIGWEIFTDKIIKHLNANCNNLVFFLWGNFAKSKATLLDPARHLILSSPHPSPFSAHSGFFGNNHFILANQYLKKNKKEEISWFF